MSDQPLMTFKTPTSRLQIASSGGSPVCPGRPPTRSSPPEAIRCTVTDEHILAAASASFTVSLVDAPALVSSRLGRQLHGTIVTPVGDDVERNAVGDSSGPSPETGLADEHAATGYIYRGTTGVGVALVIGVAMTVLAIVLAAQNTDNTTVEVFAANYRAPLIVVILAAAITGVILDEIFGFIWRRHRRHRLAERAELRRLRRTQ